MAETVSPTPITPEMIDDASILRTLAANLGIDLSQLLETVFVDEKINDIIGFYSFMIGRLSGISPEIYGEPTESDAANFILIQSALAREVKKATEELLSRFEV